MWRLKCGFRDRFAAVSLHDVIKVTFVCKFLSFIEGFYQDKVFVCVTVCGSFGYPVRFNFGTSLWIIV